MGKYSNEKVDLYKRMIESGIFDDIDDLTENNTVIMKEKIKEFLKSESSEQRKKDLKTLEKMKNDVKNKIIEKQIQEYETYTANTRVLSAIEKFLNADIEHRDKELVAVIRVLNNLKNKYDLMKIKRGDYL